MRIYVFFKNKCLYKAVHSEKNQMKTHGIKKKRTCSIHKYLFYLMQKKENHFHHLHLYRIEIEFAEVFDNNSTEMSIHSNLSIIYNNLYSIVLQRTILFFFYFDCFLF
jgi:hypothetical protein